MLYDPKIGGALPRRGETETIEDAKSIKGGGTGAFCMCNSVCRQPTFDNKAKFRLSYPSPSLAVRKGKSIAYQFRVI